MLSIDAGEVDDAFDALDADIDRVSALSFDTLSSSQQLRALERLEKVARRLPVPRHALINQLVQHATPVELGGKLTHALADRLRITRGEATRRVAEAADLGPRRALTGEPLAPRLTATAAAQRRGDVGAEHVTVIRRFLEDLPCWVDAPTQEAAEADLARAATEHRPEVLRKLADRLACYLNPDGNFSDEERARRRGLTLGKQDIDGMSPLRGWLTPEARATVEAALAKLAAPGMCNPEDQTPTVDGTPSEDAIQRDTRSPAQRNHDGLTAALRAMLASGELGQHNGLPASIVVTTTLTDLESAAGKGLTGGGTLLPMSDVIRLARNAHHYLAIFDKGKALALYHTKRLASAGQRIVLYAKDRGCSAPGCDVAGYYCEVHHLTPYAQCRTSDVNDLTFACGGHHPLAERGWTTRKRANGDTEWVPPPHLDHGQPQINSYHHPEKILVDEDGDDP
ncbi:HNH endonuclease signature motif containing protein [Mycobacterium sp.]|uniref:HNH endonuclease signature motif containing protein n=1 Tax=Mycobacterium sp. TaxID=1785 RepID=UPI003F9B76D0